MRKILITSFLLLSLAHLSIAQTIEKPSAGKSLVYILRSSGVGAVINFKYFDGDQYIGKFSGYNYVVYECDPGEHLFWVTAENRDFLKANLAPDKTYMLEAMVQMGMVKARVKFMPVDKNNERTMKRINRLLNKKDSTSFKDIDISKANSELKEYIKISLEKYQSGLDKNKTFAILKEDMFH